MSQSFPKLVKQLLDEYSSRLMIDGSAKILTFDPPVTNEILTWSRSRYTSYLPVIETQNGHDGKWLHSEGCYSHIFGTFSLKAHDHVQMLRWFQYSLQYKGIAVLLVLDSDGVDSDIVIEKLEKASFERGRIRVLDREIVSPEGGTEHVKTVIAMKWDMLSA